ncbi:peptidoglycan D,D-transpeptidase FtsI family protein [Lederbergia wuyishanensis]|uniref:serine-type D-Ala-D-Ala carboxypeptidase n=1 Tax=Lederbergia wuyishanensis TaxID=1347903 RepID=A0ABU0D1P2_9BACI|nr:penicillin-binding transpeptidase domain-containing protein [Lederbergia wuyishanensis]MCJ8006914.1 penicillin-binding protein 2 [Lederbergia wuyishanensis]MDQ0342298.1 cell division protein FtsI/penicillin-binding protein 2 [Lederbergia wuyishanensis]
MRRRRVRLLSSSILLVLLLLFSRLMQVQLFHTESFSKHHVNLLKESVKQRTQEVLIDDGRGQFLDNEGNPLSYDEKTVLVLFPFLKNINWDREQLSKIINVSKEEIDRVINNAKKPIIYREITPIQANYVTKMNIPGLFAIRKKYLPENNPASQLIGLIGENRDEFWKRYPDKKGYHSLKIGISGMQKDFDEFLIAEHPSKLIFHVDGKGAPLFGIDVKYSGQSNPYYPLMIKTTINRQFQNEIETLLDKHQIEKGGALLLDINSGNILASASRPSLNREHPFSDEGSVNMMFEQHIPGSIFKTVVAAAAIEEGLVDNKEEFNCSLNIRGEPAERDLGMLPLEESFSRSCNKTFAELAVRVQQDHPNVLEKYAENLGLIGFSGWEGNVYYVKDFKQITHAPGRIFTSDESRKDQNYIGQTGIGQHEVRVSPLGVANMMATIARGGERKAVRAVTDIQYADGGILFHFPEQTVKGDHISTSAAMRLQSLLRSVVTDNEGTGSFFQQLSYEVAGKSGTAETGIKKDDIQLHNKWFAGYFPFQNPKYALVVVNLGVPGDQGGINPLFADIVNMIYDKNREENVNAKISTQE